MTASTRVSSTPSGAGLGRDALAAWERFVAGEAVSGVPRHVLESWNRSARSGVDPFHLEVPFDPVDPDTALARAARRTVGPLMEGLSPGPVCVTVSDTRGRLLTRWISDLDLRHGLDRLSVDVGYVFAESTAGTTGVSVALADTEFAVVRGAEHFVQLFHPYTAITAVLRHPVDRRVLGTVGATVRVEHESALLGTIVGRVAERIEAALLRASPEASPTVPDALRADGPAPGAASTNPARRVRSRADVEREITRAISTGRNVLLRGESGTELSELVRRAAARTPLSVGFVAAYSAVAPEPHGGRNAAPPGRPDVLMVDHAEALDTSTISTLTHLLDRSGRRPVLALLETTPCTGIGAEEPTRLIRAAGGVRICVPALRERPADAVAIIAAELATRGCRADPDVVELIATRDSPGNDAELRQVVRDIVAMAASGAIRRDDLPLEMTLRRSRSTLSPLEVAERGVIAEALRRCSANKSETARYLGISRTALYAKISHYRLA